MTAWRLVLLAGAVLTLAGCGADPAPSSRRPVSVPEGYTETYTAVPTQPTSTVVSTPSPTPSPTYPTATPTPPGRGGATTTVRQTTYSRPPQPPAPRTTRRR
ncbi:hypothetical protein [Longispora urticae]